MEVFILQYGEPYGENHQIVSCHTTLELAEEAQQIYDKLNDISESSFGFTYIDKHKLNDTLWYIKDIEDLCIANNSLTQQLEFSEKLLEDRNKQISALHNTIAELNKRIGELENGTI